MSYNDNIMYDLQYSEQQSKAMFKFADCLVYQASKGVDRESLPYIHTYYGIKYRHIDPHPEDVYIEDIAHALSNLCRFSGHLAYFYSVGEHCVRVSYKCNPEDALEGLLHDASEAYCVDVPRPLKRAPGMEIYRFYENKTSEAIERRFGLKPEPQSVKDSDLRMLATEKRDLFREDSAWAVNKGEFAQPYPDKIEPWSPEEAKTRFLMRYYELTGVNTFYEKFKENYEEAA